MAQDCARRRSGRTHTHGVPPPLHVWARGRRKPGGAAARAWPAPAVRGGTPPASQVGGGRSRGRQAPRAHSARRQSSRQNYIPHVSSLTSGKKSDETVLAGRRTRAQRANGEGGMIRAEIVPGRLRLEVDGCESRLAHYRGLHGGPYESELQIPARRNGMRFV